MSSGGREGYETDELSASADADFLGFNSTDRATSPASDYNTPDTSQTNLLASDIREQFVTGAFVSLAPKSNPASPTQPRKSVLKSSYSAPVSPKLARTSLSVQQRVARFESLTRTPSQETSLPLLEETAAKQASFDKAHCTCQTLKKVFVAHWPCRVTVSKGVDVGLK